LDAWSFLLVSKNVLISAVTAISFVTLENLTPMKKTLPKIIALLALAAITGTSALARAADTNAPAAAEKPGPNRFYGPISAVDTNANTFTVGEQTFKISDESQVTKDAKPAKITDAVVGEPARGTYTKTADGKLVVTKVRFGKGGGKAAGKKGGGKKKDASTAAAAPNP
jgi:hypothetical protein